MSTAQLEHRPVTTKPKTNLAATAPAPMPVAPAKSHWLVWLIVMVVIVGGVVGIILVVHESKMNAAANSSKTRAVHDLPVVAATARTGDLNIYLLGLGTVTPINTVTVKSRVDGAIDKILFTEGQIVKEGDVLFQIDPRPYEAALKQAQGQLAKDQASQKSSDWNVQQDTVALKDKGISQQQLITDTATRDQATGAIEVDQAAIDTANLNITYSKITAPITGKIGLRQVDIGNIVHASDTTGLVVITQLQPITVVFALPEGDIEQIQKRVANGQTVAIDAYDAAITSKLATGSLMAIDNEIDPSTGTVKIKALFDNKDNYLFPSQFVNARMLVDTIKSAVLVPTAALQELPNGDAFVYLFKKGAPTTKPTDSGAPAAGGHGDRCATGSDAGMPGTVTIRNVKVGARQDAIGPGEEDTTAITSGLEPGDVVVTDGVDKLLEGTKVLAHLSAEPGSTSGSGPTTRPGGATTRPAGHRGHKSSPAG